jgi:anti-sigma-K factor RskA
MSDLLNILSNSNKDIDNQKLMDYLSGKLSAQEKHEFEKQMAENDMVNDAVEGLQQFKDQKNLETYVDQLQKQLNQYIQQKKQRRANWYRSKYDPWIYVAVVLVLILIVIAYVVIRKLTQH